MNIGVGKFLPIGFQLSSSILKNKLYVISEIFIDYVYGEPIKLLRWYGPLVRTRNLGCRLMVLVS